jgi:hypothetical protein
MTEDRIITVVRDNIPQGRSPAICKKRCPTRFLPETGYQPNQKEEFLLAACIILL